MKRLVIVTSSDVAPGALRLQQAARQAGHDAALALVAQPDTPGVIQRADAVIYRVGPVSVPAYQLLISQLSGRSAELLQHVMVAFNKVESLRIMQRHATPLPRTMVLSSLNQSDQIPLPAVLKIPQGNKGDGVYLVQQASDIAALRHKQGTHQSFLCQEFIAEAAGADIRLFVVGNRVVAAMQRTAPAGEFRSNVHQGGTATPYQPTAQEAALAVHVTAIHGLPFAGVDIVQSSRGPLVLEINPSPGFAIEKITGCNIATHVVHYVMGEDDDHTNT